MVSVKVDIPPSLVWSFRGGDRLAGLLAFTRGEGFVGFERETGGAGVDADNSVVVAGMDSGSAGCSGRRLFVFFSPFFSGFKFESL